ncbi:lipid A export permease/ATP-binding protein MsbA [Gammaproteobacteria bacterium]|nr:lipid A export permease/ATP-binding protein MsbA [Gammaproteobacteria bacterium]
MSTDLAASASSTALYGRLLTYLKPLWLVFFASIVGFVIFAASTTWFAALIGQLVNTIEAGANITSAERLRVPITLIVIVVLRGLGGFLGSYYMAYVANQVVHRLRCQLIDRFLVLPVSFYDRNTAGHLVSLVTYNVTQVRAAVSEAFKTMLREGCLVLALVGYLLYLNWKLTLIFVAVMPVIAFVVLFASKKFRKHSKRIQISMGDVTHILSETIKGLKVVRTFGAESNVKENFEGASERNLKQNLKMSATAAISTPIIQVVVASALAMVLWLSMSPAALAATTPGDFVSYITAAGMLLKPIRQLSKVNAYIQQGLAAAKTIFDLLDENQEKDTGKNTSDRVKGEIEFENVSFRYAEAGNSADEETVASVIQNINFHCKPGQKIAIVGKSGSGKSTLVNLIPRFYELNQGDIFIDGKPHSSFTLENLRQQIALVSQQVVLFNGSIHDNIAYGSLENVSDEEINKALVNANAMEFIKTLPEGINTLVGDDGTLLSGGQRQRLAIARALLKDAPILILDEATSALDTASERYIQSALEKLMEGRTSFVIAHRLSTIEQADIILVMSNGEIVESGTHQELLALGKHYFQLHQSQFTEV